MISAAVDTPVWVSRIVEDLRSHSHLLLDAGLAPAKGGAVYESGAPWRAVVELIRHFQVVVPRLLAELDLEEGALTVEYVTSRTPYQGAVSRSPGDFVVSGGRALPKTWLKAVPSLHVPLDALQWIYALALQLEGQSEHHLGRVLKQLDAVRLLRSGTDEFAVADLAAIDGMQADLNLSRNRLSAIKRLVLSKAGGQLTPRSSPPQTLPRSALWRDFMRLALNISNPRLPMESWVPQLLRQPVPVADVPYLYQRWVGLQLLKACVRMQWVPQGDTLAPLYLGGRIDLHRGGERAVLWIEPRLENQSENKTGWSSEESALTPDFLLTFGQGGSEKAYVLDATLSRHPHVLAHKGRYRKLLISDSVIRVAGVLVRTRPDRSWAAAPIDGLDCRLGDSSGSTGVVPMNALANEFPGLDAWLADALG